MNSGVGQPPQTLCTSAELAERGKAKVWEVLEYGRPARAFALRFDGVVRAYLNRCAHVPAEMDWQPGEFLDSDRRWIVCSIHGATYEPETRSVLFGESRGSMIAIRAETGDEVARFESGYGFGAPATAADGVVAALSNTATLLVFVAR